MNDEKHYAIFDKGNFEGVMSAIDAALEDELPELTIPDHGLRLLLDYYEESVMLVDHLEYQVSKANRELNVLRNKVKWLTSRLDSIKNGEYR